MKILLFTLTIFALTTPSLAHVDEAYSFVKDFELVDIEVLGQIANITVRHKETFGSTRFELISGQACLETLPAQCSGTIIRLDNQGFVNRNVETTFSVNLRDLYGHDNQTVIYVTAPNKDIEIRY